MVYESKPVTWYTAEGKIPEILFPVPGMIGLSIRRTGFPVIPLWFLFVKQKGFPMKNAFLKTARTGIFPEEE
jgi:hypothetical protein